MGYVFVSFSRWDRESDPMINQLLSDLRASSVNIYLVPDDVPPGVDWMEAKPEAIKNADAHLYLFSRSPGSTPAIRREIELMRIYNKPRVLVTISDQAYSIFAVGPSEFSDFTVIPLHTDYDAGLAEIVRALPTSVKRAATIERQALPSDPVTTLHAPKSKGYVFISYAEEDTEFVEKLRTFLGSKGYGYWDYQASDRNFHTQLFLELEEVITNAAATLSVLSPDWKKSTWAAKEYLFSEAVGTPVFLLQVRELGPTLVIGGVPYIDFVRDEDAGFAKLDRELKRKGLT